MIDIASNSDTSASFGRGVWSTSSNLFSTAAILWESLWNMTQYQMTPTMIQLLRDGILYPKEVAFIFLSLLVFVKDLRSARRFNFDMVLCPIHNNTTVALVSRQDNNFLSTFKSSRAFWRDQEGWMEEVW